MRYGRAAIPLITWQELPELEPGLLDVELDDHLRRHHQPLVHRRRHRQSRIGSSGLP